MGFDVSTIDGLDLQRKKYFYDKLVNAGVALPKDFATQDFETLYFRYLNAGIISEGTAPLEMANLVNTVTNVQSTIARLNTYVVTDPQFGVKADGITDDTAALTAFFNYVRSKGGGTVIFPPGTTYYLKTWVRICSNINVIALGAKFVKLNVFQYSYFGGIHEYPNTTGVGAGASNIKWTGGTFTGNYSIGLNTCAFGLHHSQNCEFDGISFVESQGAGHTFDLAGCNQIVIRRCTWRGKDIASSANAECVQLDVSGVGSPSCADPGNYDNYYTSNVTIEECQFLPYTTADGIKHPCPNPIGAHAAHTGRQPTNIRFLRNLVVNLPEDNISDIRGGIHFWGVDGLLIADNVFRQEIPNRTYAIFCLVRNRGRLIDWDPNLGEAVPLTTLTDPIPVNNVTIINNVFEGFQMNDAATLECIQVSGIPTKYATNVTIRNNIFKNKNTPLTAKGGWVKNYQVDQLFLTENTFEGGELFAYGYNCSNVTVRDNIGSGSSGYPFYYTGTAGLAVVGNNIKDCATQYIFSNGCSNITIQGNVLSGIKKTDVKNGDVIRMSGANTDFIISDNVIQGVAGITFDQAINIYGTTANGLVTNNLARGYTKAATSVSTGTNVNIATTNIVSATV